MKLSEMKALYLRAKDNYYNGDGRESVMSDAAFDRLEDAIRKRAPSWSELDKTGIRISDTKEEVSLLRPAPSLEKAYPERVGLMARRAKGAPHFGMHKLDGTSLQLVYRDKRPVQLITRGDGGVGRDVSYFIPALVRYERIPARISTSEETIFRLEALMRRKCFEKKYSKKAAGEDGYENARALVNGLFIRSWSSRILRDVSLVVLGVYPNAFNQDVYSWLDTAKAWGFETVSRFKVPQLDARVLTEALEQARSTSKYQLDGIVLAPLDFTMDYKSTDKPKRIWAFKINDEEGAHEADVVKVLWKRTRLGRWQPKIEIEPINIDGVTVTYATAHNAKWMQEKGIGVGARIKILRSGDVIPKIVDVVKRAPFTPPPGAYEFRGRFIYSVDGDDTVTRVRGLHFFCTTLDIELFAEKSLTRLYEMGITSTAALVDLAVNGPPSAFQEAAVAEFGKAQWPKMLKELRRVLTAPILLKKLMIASGAFTRGGMGVRKLAQLEDAGMTMRQLCNLDKHGIWNEVGRIKGFKSATIKLLVDGVAEFRAWYRPLKGMLKIVVAEEAAKSEGTALAGVNVAWTSYRSPEQEALVVAHGGKVVPHGSKMTVLLYKEGAKFMGKIEAAGSKAMTWDRFCKKYGLTG